MTPRYTVVVGNLGTVYEGNDYGYAADAFAEYVQLSKTGVGRVAGESVTLMDGDDIRDEYRGPVDV